MQEPIRIEAISNVEKKIFINVDSKTVGDKFDEFFNTIKKEAQVPGFRKGKVPVGVLKKYFGDRAKSTISQMLISEYYQKLLRDYNINPVGTPKINNKQNDSQYPGNFNNDNSYSVEFDIEVLPALVPVGYKNIKVSLPESQVQELMQSRLQDIREQFAERRQIDDVAQKDDTVVIDFKGYLNNEPFNGGEAKGFSIDKLNNNTLIPGFEEQIVGMKPGEQKRIIVKFPEPYNAAHLAGKEAVFEVVLHNVVRKTLAVVDNDLALIAGHDNVDTMLAAVKSEAEKLDKDRRLKLAEEQIAVELVNKNSVDLPASLVQNEKNRILQQYKGHNINAETLNSLVQRAEFNLKKTLLLEAIYEAEKDLELTPEELNGFLEEQAKINNMAKDEIVSNLYNSNQMEAFVSVLRAKKVIEFIVNCGSEERNV